MSRTFVALDAKSLNIEMQLCAGTGNPKNIHRLVAHSLRVAEFVIHIRSFFGQITEDELAGNPSATEFPARIEVDYVRVDNSVAAPPSVR